MRIPNISYCVTYGSIKGRCISSVHCMHDTMQCFQNALAYFAIAIRYMHKMFLKHCMVSCMQWADEIDLTLQEP
jgi:hypothetical protein